MSESGDKLQQTLKDCFDSCDVVDKKKKIADHVRNASPFLGDMNSIDIPDFLKDLMKPRTK